jgi:hypothetical protein
MLDIPITHVTIALVTNAWFWGGQNIPIDVCVTWIWGKIGVWTWQCIKQGCHVNVGNIIFYYPGCLCHCMAQMPHPMVSGSEMAKSMCKLP